VRRAARGRDHAIAVEHITLEPFNGRPCQISIFGASIGGIRGALKGRVNTIGGRDIRLGGGVATIRQYLRKRLVDEMHVAISPVLLGAGEHLFLGSICHSSATGQPNTFQRRTPRTSY
jgi:dihydrofolate reductase